MNRRQRVLAMFVLAAGAAASLATSQVDDGLTETHDLAPQSLDDITTVVGYQIHTEIRGSFSQPVGGLTVNLSISLAPGITPDTSLRVQLLDGNSVILDDQTVSVDSGATVSTFVSAEPFGDCDGLCERDFVVWIERGDSPGPDYPYVTPDSSVTVDIDEGDGDLPSDATLDVSVTILEGP